MGNLGSAYHSKSGWRTCKICGREFWGMNAKICEYCKSKKYSKARYKKRKEVLNNEKK